MCCMLNEAKGFDGQPVNVLQMYYGPRVAMTGVTRAMMVPSYNELFAEQHPKHSPRIEQILALGGDWKKSVKGMNLGYKCDSTYAIGTGKQSYIDGPGYQAWAARQGLRRSLASTAKVQAAANLPWVPLTGFCVTA